MNMELAQGEVSEISKRAKCTRQYASEIICDYKRGKLRKGVKASAVLKLYLQKVEFYTEIEKNIKAI